MIWKTYITFSVLLVMAVVKAQEQGIDLTSGAPCSDVQYACPPCGEGETCVYPNENGCPNSGIPTCKAANCERTLCLTRRIPCPEECPDFCNYSGPPCCPFNGEPVCEPVCQTFVPCEVTPCPADCPYDCYYPNAPLCCPKSGEAVCRPPTTTYILPSLSTISPLIDFPAIPCGNTIISPLLYDTTNTRTRRRKGGLGYKSNVMSSIYDEHRRHSGSKPWEQSFETPAVKLIGWGYDRNGEYYECNPNNENCPFGNKHLVDTGRPHFDSRHHGEENYHGEHECSHGNQEHGYSHGNQEHEHYHGKQEHEHSHGNQEHGHSHGNQEYEHSHGKQEHGHSHGKQEHGHSYDNQEHECGHDKQEHEHSHDIHGEHNYVSERNNNEHGHGEHGHGITSCASKTFTIIEVVSTTKTVDDTIFCPLYIVPCPADCPESCIYPSNVPCPYTYQPSCPANPSTTYSTGSTNIPTIGLPTTTVITTRVPTTYTTTLRTTPSNPFSTGSLTLYTNPFNTGNNRTSTSSVSRTITSLSTTSKPPVVCILLFVPCPAECPDSCLRQDVPCPFTVPGYCPGSPPPSRSVEPETTINTSTSSKECFVPTASCPVCPRGATCTFANISIDGCPYYSEFCTPTTEGGFPATGSIIGSYPTSFDTAITL